MKLLVDECLSPQLAKHAHRRGHGEASHVVWLGLAGYKDWQLRPIILAGDWVFVTRNADDFRGPRKKPGSGGEYSGVDLHAGLICLNGPSALDLDAQMELFEAALAVLDHAPDLVNQVLEIPWKRRPWTSFDTRSPTLDNPGVWRSAPVSLYCLMPLIPAIPRL